MPKKTIDFALLEERLKQLLIRSIPLDAKKACEILGISQATFSRLIGRLQNKILKIGKGRQTQYLFKGFLFEQKEFLPIYWIDQNGKFKWVATLHGIQGKGYYLESFVPTLTSRYYEDLPYLFEDLRPAGFLGRLIPSLHPELKLPENIKLWNASHCLKYWNQHGWNLAGHWLMGEEVFLSYMRKTGNPDDVVPLKDRAEAYPFHAEQILQKGEPGFSAVGEHPKFLTVKETPNQQWISVLVKFSSPIESENEVSIRTADLLICEHVAHEILSQYGCSVTTSELIFSKQRVFLEVERFDRVSIGRKEGRKGVLSLEALVNEFVEEARSWSDAAVKLFKQKIISDEMVTQICKLELFGRFIGNTDMHFGNLSFFSEGEKILGIAPVYDMLPMLYAPQGHQIIERNFDPKILSHAELLIAKEMFPLAVGFWGKISEHTQISKSFRMIAKENLQKVENLRSVMNQIE